MIFEKFFIMGISYFRKEYFESVNCIILGKNIRRKAYLKC